MTTEFKNHMILPIRDTHPDIENGTMNGDMFIVAYKDEKGKLRVKPPVKLELNEQSMSKNRFNPIALESFLAPQFSMQDVQSVPPRFLNLNAPEMVQNDDFKDLFTSVVLHGTDGRMATYVAEYPSQDEDAYIFVLKYKVKAKMIERTDQPVDKDGNHPINVSLDFNNLEFDVSVEAVHNVALVNGDISTKSIKGVHQTIELFNLNGSKKAIEDVEVDSLASELQDLFNTALDFHYGSANEELNTRLRDFYYLYIVATQAKRSMVTPNNTN